jgi:hypothetical protein
LGSGLGVRLAADELNGKLVGFPDGLCPFTINEKREVINNGGKKERIKDHKDI